MNIFNHPGNYQIAFAGVPGTYSFDRTDTKAEKEFLLKIHKHLPKYLNPERLIKDIGNLQETA